MQVKAFQKLRLAVGKDTQVPAAPKCSQVLAECEHPLGLVKKSQGVMGRELAMPASASRQPAASSCFLIPPFLWSLCVHRPPCVGLWCQFPSLVEIKCISFALRSPSAKVVKSVLRSPLPCHGPSSESYHLHPWILLDLHPHPTAGNTSRVSHLNVSFQTQQEKVSAPPYL